MQGGGGHVLLSASPEQSLHCRLPEQAQGGMGGGWTPLPGRGTSENGVKVNKSTNWRAYTEAFSTSSQTATDKKDLGFSLGVKV